MVTFLLIALFFLMIAAPCLVAVRNSRKNDDSESRAQIEALELEAAIAAAVARAAKAPETAPPLARPLTLQEMADRAEAEANDAQEVARKAHWAALAAEAKAAALRADVAAEVAAAAGRRAEKAIRAAEVKLAGNYLPADHPSLDFPRSRVKHRAA